jgi:hypothetical protein
MGCVVQEKPHLRPSWGAHGKDGFYLGPVLQHYCCWHIFVTDTKAERMSDKVAWLPEPHRMPGHSPLEEVKAVLSDLLAVSRSITVGDKALLREHSTHRPAVTEELGEMVHLLRDLYTPPDESTPQQRSAERSCVPPGFVPLPPHAVTGYDTGGIATPVPVMPVSPIPLATTAPVQRVDPLLLQHQL